MDETTCSRGGITRSRSSNTCPGEGLAQKQIIEKLGRSRVPIGRRLRVSSALLSAGRGGNLLLALLDQSVIFPCGGQPTARYKAESG